MCDDENGFPPGQRRMGESIQMNEIDPLSRCEREQPRARARDVIPGIVHPFETIARAMQRDVCKPLGLSALRLGGFRSHRRERNVHAVHRQRTTPLERIGPPTTDGVLTHDHARAAYALAAGGATATMTSETSTQ